MTWRIAVWGVLLWGGWMGAQMAAPRKAETPPPAAAAACTPALSAEDIAALRADVARMQSLVEQMERNLAFVANTSSPLKHQFELELEMWRVVGGQMERKLKRAQARAGSSAAPKQP